MLKMKFVLALPRLAKCASRVKTVGRQLLHLQAQARALVLEVYDAACTACHSTGAAGAPKKGDTAAWSPRIEKGLDTLVNHAINGFNAMPAKGGCSGCSDEEIESAVEHMVEASQ